MTRHGLNPRPSGRGARQTVHHKSRTEAEETIADYEWVYSADGCLVFCEDDAPEDGQEPPLSPAEQEAAGQLVIPGVLR